jgi:hypothetical protein
VTPDAILRCFADLAERGAASARPNDAAGDGPAELGDVDDDGARGGRAPGRQLAASGAAGARPGLAVVRTIGDATHGHAGDHGEPRRPGDAGGPGTASGRPPGGRDGAERRRPAPGPFAHVPPRTLDLLGPGAPAEPAWLGASLPLPLAVGAPTTVALPRHHEVRRLATLDALRPAERALRLGWVVVAGTPTVAGEAVPVCFPLVSQRVVVERDLARVPNLTIRPVGDLELTPLVPDPTRATPLEENAQFGGGRLAGADGPVTSRELSRLPRLVSWVRDVVAACGLPPVAELLPPTAEVAAHRGRPRLTAWVGAVLYLADEAPAARRAASLRAWAGTRGLGGTAFATLHGPGQPFTPAPAPDPIDAPWGLSAPQRAAVLRARRDALTVVAGPPGTGKTTTAAAIAVDAVSRGQSVLLATGSPTTAEILAAKLATRPGPAPVPVGRAADRVTVARATGPGVPTAEVRAAEHALAEARSRQAMVERTITNRLRREDQARSASRWDTVLDHLQSVAPRALDGADPGRLAALLRRAQGADDEDGGGRWRAKWADARLRTLVRADAGTPLAEVALAVRAAQDRQAAAQLVAAGGTTLARAWADLAAADAEVLEAAGRLAALRADGEMRRRRGRNAAERLGPLLTATPHRRRALLATVDPTALVAALPLWLGTADEVDDLLPRVPALFDLVVVDDASEMDQVTAAGALLRAKRAVVLGDPRQLRRVTDVDDEDLREALDEHGLEGQAGRLDVRRAGLLDVASGATTAVWLDEHYRSTPHLVGFPAQRFYEGRTAIATRHPANDSDAAIEVDYVTVVPGIGDPRAREVAAALDQVEHLAVLGESGIALTSPFPDVAEALARGVAERYDLDDVDRLGLRVGTVDAFRLTLADHVVLALGVAPTDPPARRRALEAPDLFNVMVSRAQRKLTVVTVLDAPSVATPAGLIDAFLAYAARTPTPPQPAPAPVSDWVQSLVDELRAHGAAAQPNYPVGRWVVDLCAGKEGDAVAVETQVHPDGPEAHIERHRALLRTGWRVVDGYPSRWDGDAARAAFDITEALRR